MALADRQAVVGVLTDIDDTLTRDGAIEPVALQALHDLQAAGLPVIAVTGRPLGWSRPFAMAWPVGAIVAENGAVALWRDGGALQVDHVQDAATRAANTPRLQAAAASVLARVPGATLARDSAGRLTDIAIDHAEFASLDAAAVEQVVRALQAQGLNVSVSSIHVNAWFGEHDKWSGANWIVRQRLGRCLADEVDHWVYVGDSPNDQAMFSRFGLSVGVANLMDFAGRLNTWPAYLTAGQRGQGFAEVARLLLAARGCP
jgi:hypothetical protein